VQFSSKKSEQINPFEEKQKAARQEIGSKHIEWETDGAGDSREVLVQGKERSTML